MKKILYVLNDCRRTFTYGRTAGICQAFARLGEPVELYIVRSDGYSAFAPEHNCGEYNIYRLPDYRGFDGIILDINSVFSMTADTSAAEGTLFAVQSAVRSGRPVISMASGFDGCCYVGIDNYAAIQSVIRCLHRELGLNDFWFVMGPPDNYENSARTQGLMDYCRENGIACGEDRFFAESFLMKSGVRAFRELYARHGGTLPQAVICANDFLALGVCSAAEKIGCRIPGDLMVTGFDNDDVSAYLSPAVTTVDQNADRMGEVCAKAMRRTWRGETVPDRIRIPTDLILRESTGHTDDQSNMGMRMREYIDRSFSNRDFRYRLSTLQYQLPGCKSIEEIGTALAHCLEKLGCSACGLILDSDLLDDGYALRFDDQMGRLQDIVEGMPTRGYSDNMELVFLWEAGRGARLVRQKVGAAMYAPGNEEGGENFLFSPIHFMEYTVGYLVIRGCLDLIRIEGVSPIVNTLTMTLRNYFSRKILSSMNRLLSGISMKDELTGLYNRLGYQNLAYPMFRDLRRSGGRLGILFLDLDRLKQINDSYGHAAGDKAIRSAANAIARSIPADAIAVRYGGDEFLVLAPAAGLSELGEILGAISAALPEEARRLGSPDIPGISAGSVVSDLDESRTLDFYVQEADDRMYEEKKRKKRQR